jgi:5-methylcytosine-specific restriction endonuclease McrA
MNRFEEDFIERASEMLKDNVDEYLNFRRKMSRIYEKNNPNTYYYKEKYEKSEKGQIARKKTTRNRLNRMREAMQLTSDFELMIIRNFYRNCPKGYHVDHIIPISKGGLHTLSNLQYLTAEENFKKAYRLNWKKDEEC